MYTKLDPLTLYIQEKNPACILLTETWLSPVVPDSLIGLNDYILYRTDRTSRGGGVYALLNRTIFKQFSVTSCSKNYGNIELIRVTCVSSCQSFSMVYIYRPPGTSVVEDQLLART
ncbi:hypothetical protein Zmor_017985 [Zophobas morio]|uniref:Reverse transcriptase domain-containing protein n=1 Tax=Zophobas morio TaxID=2755281 RepID=A0AA38MD86_9CUCU|nr:hypothetical protein Zmor_017985 [Zophobas morio]